LYGDFASTKKINEEKNEIDEIFLSWCFVDAFFVGDGRIFFSLGVFVDAFFVVEVKNCIDENALVVI